MTELRRRMIEDMKLHGFSERTRASYLATVRQLAKHYMRSPDPLSEEELRIFFLHLVQERKASPSTVRQYLSGIKFLYERTLGRDWPTLPLLRPAKRRTLPVILSREEVWDLLGRVETFKHRVALNLIYSCGLRLLEATHLRLTVQGVDKVLTYLARYVHRMAITNSPHPGLTPWPKTGPAAVSYARTAPHGPAARLFT